MVTDGPGLIPALLYEPETVVSDVETERETERQRDSERERERKRAYDMRCFSSLSTPFASNLFSFL